MKVISLLQPWASLVVLGHKKIETRSWRTKHRGPLLIHASAPRKSACRSMMLDFQQEFYHLDLPKFETLPFGAIIGKVNLVDCFNTNNYRNYDGVPITKYIGEGGILHQEKTFGDYSSDRYAWLLSDPVMFATPTPAKGKLSIWEFDESLLIK